MSDVKATDVVVLWFLQPPANTWIFHASFTGSDTISGTEKARRYVWVMNRPDDPVPKPGTPPEGWALPSDWTTSFIQPPDSP